MKVDIDRLTESELLDLNRRVVERLKMIDQLKAHGAMMKYRVGEKVFFLDREGRKVLGTLTKYNKKTVTIISEDGLQWNVSPGLLEKYKAKETLDLNYVDRD